MPTQKAEAEWQGNLAKGRGWLNVGQSCTSEPSSAAARLRNRARPSRAAGGEGV